MQLIQRPVAESMYRGEWALNLELGKRTPAIFLQLCQMCQGAMSGCSRKLTKKFAPEIKVPAQKNQNCSLCLAVTVEYGAVVRPAWCCLQEQPVSWEQRPVSSAFQRVCSKAAAHA